LVQVIDSKQRAIGKGYRKLATKHHAHLEARQLAHVAARTIKLKEQRRVLHLRSEVGSRQAEPQRVLYEVA